jgi:hypothetical protein
VRVEPSAIARNKHYIAGTQLVDIFKLHRCSWQKARRASFGPGVIQFGELARDHISKGHALQNEDFKRNTVSSAVLSRDVEEAQGRGCSAESVEGYLLGICTCRGSHQNKLKMQRMERENR